MDTYAGLYMVRRDEWGAADAARPIAKVTHTHLEIHHGASPNDSATNFPKSVLREYQRGHLAKGWSDLFYNLALDPNNVLYEGRGVGLKSQGTALTVVMLGNYDEIPPTPEMMATLKILAESLPNGIDGVDWHRRRAEGTKYASACPGIRAITEIKMMMATGKDIPAKPDESGAYMDFYAAWSVVTSTYRDAWGIPGDAEGTIFWTQVLMSEGFSGYVKFIRALAAVTK